MTKRRICVLVTARPSYSRIRSALRAIQDHPDLELQLVVAASALLERYGSAIQAIEHDGFVPKARVYMVLEGENLVTSAKSTGLGLVELATVFDNLQPDAVVTVADRYETLATAVAASYMNIPVVHVQGGFLVSTAREAAYHADVHPDDVLHYVADPGWIMGPWAIVGAHALGAAVVCAEGAPDHPEPPTALSAPPPILRV